MAEGWKRSGFFGGEGIPAPSGVYGVGCVDFMGQLEGDDLGGLLVRLFYPTAASPGVPNGGGYSYAPWLPSKMYLKGYLGFNKNRFSGILSSVLSAFIAPMTPALMNAPLLEAGVQVGDEATPTSPPAFPVIVFSHGLGAMRTSYSGITCDLASHGYVVASVEHRDQSACISHRRVPKQGGKDGEFEDEWLQHRSLEPDEDEFVLRNKQVKQRADEAKKTLDILGLLNDGADIRDMFGSGYKFGQFKGRLDLSRVGITGHSFGGATSILTLQEDSRFKCGIAMDGWMLPLYRKAKDSIGSSLSKPLYFINAFSFQWKDNVLKMMSLCSPPDASGKTPRRVLTLDRTEHMNQCDVLFVAPSSILRWIGADQSVQQNTSTAHKANMDICHAFFKRHLLQDPECEGPVAVLDGGEGHSPVIIFGTNVDLGDSEENNPSSDTEGAKEEDVSQADHSNDSGNGANKL